MFSYTITNLRLISSVISNTPLLILSCESYCDIYENISFVEFGSFVKESGVFFVITMIIVTILRIVLIVISKNFFSIPLY